MSTAIRPHDRLTQTKLRQLQLDRKAVSIGFGIAGIGLGTLELMAPRAFARFTGIEGREETVRFMGLREVATGIALLSPVQPSPWMKARAAGDLFDAAIFASAIRTSNPRRTAACLMFAASVGAFCLDAFFSSRVEDEQRFTIEQTPDSNVR